MLATSTFVMVVGTIYILVILHLLIWFTLWENTEEKLFVYRRKTNFLMGQSKEKLQCAIEIELNCAIISTLRILPFPSTGTGWRRT